MLLMHQKQRQLLPWMLVKGMVKEDFWRMAPRVYFLLNILHQQG